MCPRLDSSTCQAWPLTSPPFLWHPLVLFSALSCLHLLLGRAHTVPAIGLCPMWEQQLGGTWNRVEREARRVAGCHAAEGLGERFPASGRPGLAVVRLTLVFPLLSDAAVSSCAFPQCPSLLYFEDVLLSHQASLSMSSRSLWPQTGAAACALPGVLHVSPSALLPLSSAPNLPGAPSFPG